MESYAQAGPASHLGTLAPNHLIRHYTALQDFYEGIFGNLNIHFPLWFPGTKDAAEGTLNSNRFLAEACKCRRGQRVLDAGCGVGGSALWLAENYNVQVTAISLVESNIKRCRQLAAQKKLEHLVQFHVSDFMNETFEPATFDAIWNIESFIYALPKERYIRNSYRMLKPGGIWACLDGFACPELGRNSATLARLSRVNDGFVLTDAHWESASWLQLSMKQRGFCNVQWTDVTSYVLQAPRRRYIAALALSVFNLKELAGNPELYRFRLKSFLATFNLFRLMERKAVAYGLVTGEKPLRKAM